MSTGSVDVSTTGVPGVRAVAQASMRMSVYILTAVVLLSAVVVAPDFYDPGNLRTVALQVSVLTVVTLGQAVVLISKGIDMSVSAVAAATAFLLVGAVPGFSGGAAVATAAALAVVVGVVNGLLVVWRGVPPFVATFAVFVVLGGLSMALTKGQVSGSAPEWVRSTVGGGAGPVPAAVLIAGLVGVVLHLALSRTAWGRWVYAIGANPEAARFAAVPVGPVKVSAYVIGALCALLGGLMASGYLGYIDQNVGSTFNLNSIAAAIVGGVAFSGGRGTVLGAACGALLLTALMNILTVVGLPFYFQLVVTGSVLILAVVASGLHDRASTT